MADNPLSVPEADMAALRAILDEPTSSELIPVDETILHGIDEFVNAQVGNIGGQSSANDQWDDIFNFDGASLDVPMARELTAAENDDFTALWNSIDVPVSTATEAEQVPRQASASTALDATMQHDSEKKQFVENPAQPATDTNTLPGNTGEFKHVLQDIDHSFFGNFTHDDPSHFNLLTDDEISKLEILPLNDAAFQQSLLAYSPASLGTGPGGRFTHLLTDEPSNGEMFGVVDSFSAPGFTPAPATYTESAPLVKPIAAPVITPNYTGRLTHVQTGPPSGGVRGQASARSLQGQTSTSGHGDMYLQAGPSKGTAAPQRPKDNGIQSSVRTTYPALPLPPSSSAHYTPGIGWHVRSNADDSNAQFNRQIGYYRPLMAQRFVATPQLPNVGIPPNAPFMTEAGMRQSRKRPAGDIQGESASGRNKRPLLSSTPQSSVPDPIMTFKYPHPHKPPRPPRTEFPYDAPHPLKGRKGSFDIQRDCTCENITLPDRAPNSFLLFRSEFAKNAGKVGQTKISKDASDAWERLDDLSKHHYEALAKEKETALLQRHPNYKYVPKAKEMIRFGFEDCFCGAYYFNLALLQNEEPQVPKKGTKRQRTGRNE